MNNGIHLLQESMLEGKNEEIKKLQIERDWLMKYVDMYKNNTLELEDKIKIIINKYDRLKAWIRGDTLKTSKL